VLVLLACVRVLVQLRVLVRLACVLVLAQRTCVRVLVQLACVLVLRLQGGVPEEEHGGENEMLRSVET
jgi:hypothetical protein